MWHIVYLSFDSSPGGRNYIGKHTTKNLYDGYLGSFTDPTFTPDSRIILGYFRTAQAAVTAEIQWQRVFQVATDETFANKSYQTSVGFICVGHTEESKQKMRDADRKINPNSLKSALGKSWFYQPASGEEVLGFECPPGFIPGRLSMVSKNPGKNKTEETRSRLSLSLKQIPKEDRYWYGKEGNASGTQWWRNPDTGETKRSKTQPGPTWILGRK